MIAALCLFCMAPVIPVAADDPVVLVMGGEGTTPWSVSNIVPGDSGTKNVTVRNDGSVAGNLYIWVTNIVDSEGLNPEAETGNTAEPGELTDYMLFSVSSARITTNVSMPGLLGAFPRNTRFEENRVLSLVPVKPFRLFGNGNCRQLPAILFRVMPCPSISSTLWKKSLQPRLQRPQPHPRR